MGTWTAAEEGTNRGEIETEATRKEVRISCRWTITLRQPNHRNTAGKSCRRIPENRFRIGDHRRKRDRDRFRGRTDRICAHRDGCVPVAYGTPRAGKGDRVCGKGRAVFVSRRHFFDLYSLRAGSRSNRGSPLSGKCDNLVDNINSRNSELPVLLLS